MLKKLPVTLPLVLGLAWLPAHATKDDTRAQLKRFAKTYATIQKQYIEPVSNEEMITHAISGMLNFLDPHSEYITGEDYDDLINDTPTFRNGVGVDLIYKKESPILIDEVIDNSPASRAGILPGDLISKINQIDVTQKTQTEAFALFDLDEPQVELVVYRPSTQELRTLVLQKERVQIQNISSRLLKDKLLYVRVRQFNASTLEDFVQTLVNFNKTAADEPPQGMILDLRNNPGGDVEKAIGLASAFLPQNVVVASIRGRRDNRIYFNSASDYDELGFNALREVPKWVKSVPLVVLSNAASASASELVMGALQDHHRAKVLGTRSFGKGSVQQIIPSPDDHSAIKLTTALYYTPKYRVIQANGITPDIAISDTPKGNILSAVHEWHLPNHLRAGMVPAPDGERFLDSQFSLEQFRLGGAQDFQLIQAQRVLLNQRYDVGQPNHYLNLIQESY